MPWNVIPRQFVFRAIAIVCLFYGSGHCLADSLADVSHDITFENDVMAVFSKAGCNLGACHGNQNGKGGFRLTLRGQSPKVDYDVLVSDLKGRRISLARPEKSLILLKPTAQVPHQGGVRFGHGSVEYEIIRRWLADGARGPSDDTADLIRLEVKPKEKIVADPSDSVQLRVRAFFSDGTDRDVTTLAVYETSNLKVEVGRRGLVTRSAFGEATVVARYLHLQVPVRLAFIPARPDFVWTQPTVENYVDRLVDDRLRKLRVNVAELADDHTFVRRAYLDTLGLMPTVEEARQFIADDDPRKREALIDELLTRSEFADHWALKWSDLLRVEEKVLDPRGVDVFHGWIRECFSQGTPMDAFVRQLVAARGSTYKNAPANFYRAIRDPFLRGESAARLFLGVRLQCAKCHNHPFDRWTQDDYYSWASVFATLDYEVLANKRRDRLDKNEFNGEQIVLVNEKGSVKNPATGKNAKPRFLGDERFKVDDQRDRLHQLADWLTSPENRQFARSVINRVVYHLLGRGLVEPIDDFRLTNPPSNPELLEALVDDFIQHEFDIRHILRVIMRSRTYQLSSRPTEVLGEDVRSFSFAIARRLTAEQLLDAQCQVLGVAAELNGYPEGIRAGQVPGVRRVRLREQRPGDGDRFLMTFGKPKRLIACECERSDDTTLSQVLLLTSGQGMNRRLTESDNRLARMVESSMADEEILGEIYWSALARPPTRQELEVGLHLLAGSDDRFQGLQDIAWAVLNSKEFVFRW